MFAIDFEYDGNYLSDYGFVICNFGGSSGTNTVSAGSKITFNTTPRHGGTYYGLLSTKYDECITASFEVCKDPCKYDDLVITQDEYRDLMRWLNRREFLPFQIKDSEKLEYESVYFDASFNIEKIMYGEELYGLVLNMETNRPFGYGQEQTFKWTISRSGEQKVISDVSDEIGYIYPRVKITISSSSMITIENQTFETKTTIKNCQIGEVITIDGDTQIVESSVPSHQIYNDFNYVFPKIGNTLDNRNNVFTFSAPCEVEISYTPIIKDTSGR